MEETISASTKVKKYIFSELEHNNLKVGDRLPAEAQLAAQLDVSRSSVREALQSLKSIGLLNSAQGSCYTITRDATKIFSEALRAIIATTPIHFTDISEIREALEIKAAQLAICHHVPTDSIKYLQDCIKHMQLASNSTSNISEATKYDIYFHKKIAELSGNPFLISFISALSQFSDRYILISWKDITQEQISQLLASHSEIVQCLEKNDDDIKKVIDAIINHYRIADNIIKSATSTKANEKQSIERILKKLYSEGLNNEQILNKLSSLE